MELPGAGAAALWRGGDAVDDDLSDAGEFDFGENGLGGSLARAGLLEWEMATAIGGVSGMGINMDAPGVMMQGTGGGRGGGLGVPFGIDLAALSVASDDSYEIDE